MRIDIGMIESRYRGIERGLLLEHLMDFNVSYSKKETSIITKQIETYENIINDEPNSVEKLQLLIGLTKNLCRDNKECEVIAYDRSPMKQVFGYPIQLLGIDITQDLAESLLATEWERVPKHLLNENGLLKEPQELTEAISFCRAGDANWEPCWVYKVLTDEPAQS